MMFARMGACSHGIAGSVPNFWLPDSASTLAVDIDRLFYWLLIVGTVACSLLVTILLRGLRCRRIEPSFHANDRLAVWMLAAILVLAFGGLAAAFGRGLTTWLEAHVPPADALEIQITAEPSAWRLEIPSLDVRANEFVVPAEQAVLLRVRAVGGAYRWSAPALRLNTVVGEGQETSVWFEASKPGQFDVIVGDESIGSHGIAPNRLRVLDRESFTGWASEHSSDATLPPVELGAKLFDKLGCAACHSTTAQQEGKACPPLGGRFGGTTTLIDGQSVTFDAEYVRESLNEPTSKVARGFAPVMPSFRDRLQPRQLDALVAYLESLR